MQVFLPVPATSSATPGCVQLGDKPVKLSSSSSNPRKRIERLQTQATFHAGCAATGCTSPYELEQKWGPDALQPGQNITEWSATRNHMWDRWRRGVCSVIGARRRGSQAIEKRLAAVRVVSPLIDDVLAMSFWRYIDPNPLTTTELEPQSGGEARYAAGKFFGPFGVRNAIASCAAWLLKGLESDETRYDAMSGLWLQMRSSCSVGALGNYALYYLCWLHARPSLETDPVFGKLVPELYAYTHHHFSCLALAPATSATFKDALLSLRCHELHPDCEDDSLVALVKPSLLMALLSEKQKRSRAFRQ